MKKIYIFLFLAGISISTKAQWTAAHPMNATRAEQVSANIAGGKVLVAGGWNYITNLKTAEIYDPVANTWTSTASMSDYHSSGKAVTLNNGKVLVVGGFNGSSNVASAELYDPSTSTWSSAGSLDVGVSYHTITLLQNGQVLVTGGFDGSYNHASAQLYDPISNSWSFTDSMAAGRSYHTAVLLNSGKVLVIGGFNLFNFQLNSTEIYDPATGHWTAGPLLNDARDHHAASLLADGRVLVTGGRYFNGSNTFAYNGITSAELYDPAHPGSWTYANYLNVEISYHQQITLPDGNVLLIAGIDSSNFNSNTGAFTTTPSVTQLYEPDIDFWSNVPLTQDARYEFSSILMSNGVVLVTGGVDNTAEKYSSSTGINEHSSAGGTDLGLYPNPAYATVSLIYGSFYHIGENVTVAVVNLLGETIAEYNIILNNASSINVENLSSGVYFIQVTGDKGRRAAKFIKE